MSNAPLSTTALLLLFLKLLFHPTCADVNLPFGDVNVIVLTDVHSWVAGHSYHEPFLNIDYGDVVSFVELLKQLEPNKDIFCVVNGDVVDGTGLSVPYPPTHLTPILKFMPWDALNIGNHELYDNVNIEHFTKEGGFVDHWNGHYLTSNVIMADTLEPIGSRFTYLQGKNTGSKILTFGFLYDFTGHCNITEVEHVQDVVQSYWFVGELTNGDFDAILVLAHFDVEDPLVYTILNATRSIVGDSMPIQFITGHTHYRGYKELDANSVSLEAGRYLDTVGFVSFPIKKKNESIVVPRNDSFTFFQHVFLDANRDILKDTLGMDDMTTSSGSALSSLIEETRQDLGLNEIVGCSLQHYYLEHGLDKPDSLWGFYLTSVVLKNYFRYNQSKVLIQSTGSLRYDLFDGNVTKDDVIAVSPFTDDIYKVSQLTLGADIIQAFGIPNEMSNTTNVTINGHVVALPEYAMTGTIHPDAYYDVYAQSISVSYIQEKLNVTANSFFTPEKQFHMDGTVVTTVSLWFDYIEKHWSCEDPSVVKVANRWLVVLFSVAAAVIFFGYRYFSKRRNDDRRGYDNTVAIEEDDDMIL